MFLVLTILSESGFADGAYTYLEKYQPKATADLRLRLENYLGTDPLTLDVLEKIANEAIGYEDFLRKLKQRAAPLFEQYVLLHGTGSLQPATREEPRVVLFGDGAFVSLAAKAKEVEALVFDEKSRSFRSAEISFNGSLPRFQRDPLVCTACHGEEVRPLWEPYDFWPTAYGSAIGRFRSTAEQKAYQQLFRKKSSAGVLALLEDHAYEETAGRYKLDDIEAFTLILSALNFARANRTMAEIFDAIGDRKYAVLAALQLCRDFGDGADGPARVGGFDAFFPDDVWASAPLSYEWMLKDTYASRRTFKQSQTKRYDKAFGTFEELFSFDIDRLSQEATAAARVRFVLENLGLTVDWVAMSTGSNRFSFSTPSNFSHDWLTVLADADPTALRNVGAIGGWVSISCEKALTLSQDAFRRLRWSKAKTVVSLPAVPVVGRCQRCHSPAVGGAPSIAFDDTMALRRQLAMQPELHRRISKRVRATDQSRMPPKEQLTAKEISALEELLQRLTTK